jgi:hypothetical protein
VREIRGTMGCNQQRHVWPEENVSACTSVPWAPIAPVS